MIMGSLFYEILLGFGIKKNIIKSYTITYTDDAFISCPYREDVERILNRMNSIRTQQYKATFLDIIVIRTKYEIKTYIKRKLIHIDLQLKHWVQPYFPMKNGTVCYQAHKSKS